MRTTIDVLRSVGKHVAAGLGDPWEVRFADEKGAMVEPPYALVALVAPALSSRNSLYVDMTVPVTVYCYPEPGEGEEEAILLGERVSDELWRLFVGGVEPYRVPLYDYDGIGLFGGGSDERHEHDYMRLVDVNVTTVPDPADSRRPIVVADFRASWRRPTERLSVLRGGPVLQSVRQTIIPEGARQDVPVGGFTATNTRFGRIRASRAA